MTLIHGDCVQVMADMPEASIDAIVCDPPYGLEFMGKEWDRLGRDGPASFENLGQKEFVAYGRTAEGTFRDRPRFSTLTGESMRAAQQWHSAWATAALRVAKPGAYLLAFGGTRTVHRMTVALEDAGWIIRDMLVWAYASGFPKSRALLKPAWEPIVMARKPGPLRDLDIDGCRIGTDGGTRAVDFGPDRGVMYGGGKGKPTNDIEALNAGRWPANIVLTDPIFDGDTEGIVGGGTISAPKPARTGKRGGSAWHGQQGFGSPDKEGTWPEDPGGTPSRFFLIPKASRSDREPVMPGMLEEDTPAIAFGNRVCRNCGRGQFDGRRDGPCCDDPDYVVAQVGKGGARRNVHPTVKPIELMRHLVRLVTPAGGTVLDPFLGSGTTALAAEQEGRAWVGIEREAEYVRIAEARLSGWQRGLGLEVG